MLVPEQIGIVRHLAQAVFLVFFLLRRERLVVIGNRHSDHRLLGLRIKPGLRTLRSLLARSEDVLGPIIFSGRDFIGHRRPNECAARSRIHRTGWSGPSSREIPPIPASQPISHNAITIGRVGSASRLISVTQQPAASSVTIEAASDLYSDLGISGRTRLAVASVPCV